MERSEREKEDLLKQGGTDDSSEAEKAGKGAHHEFVTVMWRVWVIIQGLFCRLIAMSCGILHDVMLPETIGNLEHREGEAVPAPGFSGDGALVVDQAQDGHGAESRTSDQGSPVLSEGTVNGFANTSIDVPVVIPSFRSYSASGRMFRVVALARDEQQDRWSKVVDYQILIRYGATRTSCQDCI